MKFLTLATLLALISPVQPILLGTGVMLFLSLFTSVWRDLYSQKITVSVIFHSLEHLKPFLTKLIGYQIGVVTGLVMQKYLLQGFPVPSIVAGVIALAEGKTIFQNLGALTGTNFWTVIIKKIYANTEEIE